METATRRDQQDPRIVGETKGLKSLAGAYVFLLARDGTYDPSQHDAPRYDDHYLIRCKTPEGDNSEEAEAGWLNLAADLNAEFEERRDMSVWTSSEYSPQSRMHWLLKTKAGIALGYTALLGLLVGAVVTSQTLYAATTASAKEYAILLAMGIPRRRVTMTVLVQSFWVGLFGVVVAYPTVHLLAEIGKLGGVQIPLPWELLGIAAGITLIMSMIAGFIALRSVRKIEPMALLR